MSPKYSHVIRTAPAHKVHIWYKLKAMHTITVAWQMHTRGGRGGDKCRYFAMIKLFLCSMYGIPSPPPSMRHFFTSTVHVLGFWGVVLGCQFRICVLI